MRHLIITMAVIVVTALTGINAQQTTTVTEEKKIITHNGGDHYEVVYRDAYDRIYKTGSFLKMGEELKPHGIWRMYDRTNFRLITSAKYIKGEQVWVRTQVDGKLTTIDREDIKVKELENRIAELEKKIQDLQD